MLVYTKAEGEFKEHDWTQTELKDWFTENTDKDGTVQDEIILFGNTEIKAVDDGYDWTLSDYTLDRDGERIDPAGWDVKSFKKNPVLLWAHDYARPAIGKVTSPKIKDGSLVGRVSFDSDNDEFARLIEGKVKAGILNTGSVGFRSIAVELTEDKAKEEAWLIHRKQELFEFSICNVPSNPAAMRRDYATSGYLTTATTEEYEPNTETQIATQEGKLIVLDNRIKKLEDERNIYRDLFKDRDEINSATNHEISDEFKDIFEEPANITMEELING